MLQWFQKSSDVSEEPERRNKNTSKITVNPTVSQYDLQPMFRYPPEFNSKMNAVLKWQISDREIQMTRKNGFLSVDHFRSKIRIFQWSPC